MAVGQIFVLWALKENVKVPANVEITKGLKKNFQIVEFDINYSILLLGLDKYWIGRWPWRKIAINISNLL